MTKEQIFGLVRHLLTFGGGFLVTNGFVAAPDLETGVGALVTLIGLVWSWWSKKSA